MIRFSAAAGSGTIQNGKQGGKETIGTLAGMQWRMLSRSFESSAAAGSLLLAGALLIAGFARWGAPGLADDLRLSCSMIALVTWWVASVVFCFGVNQGRL